MLYGRDGLQSLGGGRGKVALFGLEIYMFLMLFLSFERLRCHEAKAPHPKPGSSCHVHILNPEP